MLIWTPFQSRELFWLRVTVSVWLVMPCGFSSSANVYPILLQYQLLWVSYAAVCSVAFAVLSLAHYFAVGPRISWCWNPDACWSTQQLQSSEPMSWKVNGPRWVAQQTQWVTGRVNRRNRSIRQTMHTAGCGIHRCRECLYSISILAYRYENQLSLSCCYGPPAKAFAPCSLCNVYWLRYQDDILCFFQVISFPFICQFHESTFKSISSSLAWNDGPATCV